MNSTYYYCRCPFIISASVPHFLFDYDNSSTMRSCTLPLWLATFFTLFTFSLACKQRYYIYYKEYANCNEGLEPAIKERAARECSTFRQPFVELSDQTHNQLGRDITAELVIAGGTLPDNSANCIFYQCNVVAWRYREWQTDMEHRALPSFDGWKLHDRVFGPGTVKCD